MADPYMGELRMMSFHFAPKGWASADGQLLPVDQNTALYALFGNTYGGQEAKTFNLPNLKGHIPIHVYASAGFTRGKRGGEDWHTLQISELPLHSHELRVSTSGGDAPVPKGNVLATTTRKIYAEDVDIAQSTTLRDTSVGGAGAGLMHSNIQPYQNVNWCVALMGVYPS